MEIRNLIESNKYRYQEIERLVVALDDARERANWDDASRLIKELRKLIRA